MLSLLTKKQIKWSNPTFLLKLLVAGTESKTCFSCWRESFFKFVVAWCEHHQAICHMGFETGLKVVSKKRIVHVLLNYCSLDYYPFNLAWKPVNIYHFAMKKVNIKFHVKLRNVVFWRYLICQKILSGTSAKLSCAPLVSILKTFSGTELPVLYHVLVYLRQSNNLKVRYMYMYSLWWTFSN